MTWLKELKARLGNWKTTVAAVAPLVLLGLSLTGKVNIDPAKVLSPEIQELIGDSIDIVFDALVAILSAISAAALAVAKDK